MSTDYYYDRPAPRGSILPALVSFLLLVSVAGLLLWRFWPLHGSGLDPGAQPRAVTPRGDLTNEEKTNIAIYLNASSSVVHVTNLANQHSQFNLNMQQIPRGTGSGFVWDTDGHIVTNYHVIEGADAAQVTLADHTTYAARQIWGYREKDIAVVWIDAPKDKLRPLAIGTSHDLKVGQITFAIGNPFGLDQSMTTGIVSALGREIDTGSGRPLHGAIQTSAAINPGNSGGPLLDSAGRLIGMTTAILSPSGASAGIGFAIPVDEINEIVPQLIRNGKVVRPRLGVQLAEDQLAQQLGVKEGALIIKVMPNTPAAAAGLQGTRRDDSGRVVLGDIILNVGGKAIKHSNDVSAALQGMKVGQTLTVGIQRGQEHLDVNVTLQAAE